jgi:dephospho-CoA kinase
LARFPRIGVTGGIASGKSQVVKRLAAAGFHTIDLDRVAHEVMEPGHPAYEDVVEAFGPKVLGGDGRIDRKALGQVVFADAAARERLDGIVHPRVREEENARAARADGPVATEAALLVEAGMHLRFDRLIVAYCSPETQVARLCARNGLSREDALRRIRAQMPIDQKRSFAHFTVDTEGTLSDTEVRADALARDLLAQFASLPPGDQLDPQRAARGLLAAPRRGPRGLDPEVFVETVRRSGGIELATLARHLRPPAEGPWYRAARPGEGDPRPIALSAAVAVYCSLRAPGDESYLVAAMASVARLTHADTASVGEACLFALAAQAAWSGETKALAALQERVPRWRALAARWAGGEVGDPSLASMLSGGGAAPGEAAAPSSAREALEALARAAGADRPVS